MNSVFCKINIPKVEGLEDAKLTVGRHFTLDCQGEWNKSFDFTLSSFVSEKVNTLQMKAFTAQATDLESFAVDATIYAPISITSGSVFLTDGQNQILLNHDPIKVESVIEAQGGEQAGAPPQPYGFVLGQMSLSYIYYALIAAAVVAAVSALFVGIQRRRYWRKLELGMRQYETPISPDSQAYRTLRALEKGIARVGHANTQDTEVRDVQSQLQNCVYLYILRRFQVPIFDLKSGASNRKLNAYLKAKWPRLKNQRRKIFHFVNDIQALDKLSSTEQASSMQAIVKRFYEFIDESENLFSKRSQI